MPRTYISHLPELEPRTRIRTDQATYRVIEKLGRGGNSIVYLVVQIDGDFPGLLFAMKIFVRIDRPERRARFEVEIEFLRRADHPAILRIHDTGYFTDPGGSQAVQYPYVMAEYLPKTLRAEMQGRMSMADKLSCALQLLSALIYLERRTPAITHRDIKPENIFVSGRSCILGDFGLLKELSGGVAEVPVAGGGVSTASGEDGDHSDAGEVAVALGPRFAIEDSSGVRFPFLYPTPDLLEYCRRPAGDYLLTTKSDVFQLGLVFAELFTGVLPLGSRERPYDPVQLLPLAEINCSRSRGTAVAGLIRNMLALNPEDRPNASDLFDSWEGLFSEAAADSLNLDGVVFR